MARTKILILGGSFAGLQIARHLRDFMDSEAAEITVVDRKTDLLFIPNILLELFEGKDPNASLLLSVPPLLDKDGSRFVQAEVTGIDLDKREVDILPCERPGSASAHLPYDYLVIALGNRLAFDKIEGFADYGHTVTDSFSGNKLRHYLYDGEYKGGPIAIGSARFHQGTRGKLDFIPVSVAACEGPPVETALSLAAWLEEQEKGGAKNITMFTPAKRIAEDAGEKVVDQLLDMAGKMGFGYKHDLQDIRRLTGDGIEFANGESLEAELKIIFPDWVPHTFLKGLSICDEEGFVITNRQMRNPDRPEVFAAGDAAAATVPKLGSIGHHQSYIVARQIAREMGFLDDEAADEELYNPEVICYGDMGNHKGFYIHSNSWYGGQTQLLKMGRFYYDLKVGFKTAYFALGGKVPHWQWKMGTWMGDTV